MTQERREPSATKELGQSLVTTMIGPGIVVAVGYAIGAPMPFVIFGAVVTILISLVGFLTITPPGEHRFLTARRTIAMLIIIPLLSLPAVILVVALRIQGWTAVVLITGNLVILNVVYFIWFDRKPRS